MVVTPPSRFGWRSATGRLVVSMIEVVEPLIGVVHRFETVDQRPAFQGDGAAIRVHPGVGVGEADVERQFEDQLVAGGPRPG